MMIMALHKNNIDPIAEKFKGPLTVMSEANLQSLVCNFQFSSQFWRLLVFIWGTFFVSFRTFRGQVVHLSGFNSNFLYSVR
jgi:hypothetical protein